MAKDLRECRLEDLPGPKSKQELDEMRMPYEEYCKAVFAPGHEMAKPEALKGIRWLSTTMYIFTPHSVANLAELGAEVIKVEMPRMGDPMKHTSPFNEAYLYPLHDTRPVTGTGYGFMNANPNEYYLSMDYHLPEMKEAFYRLIKMSDGLTECYRPGTFDRWKQSYRFVQELNPRFIYVWGGGFGYGPKCFGGSYDILGQAHAGLASVTGMHEFMGGHCTKHSNWCIDWYSGTQITFGICGKTDFPDAINPQDKFDARYAMVSAFQDADFKALCDVIKKPDMYSKYMKHKDRVGAEAQVDIYAELEDWAKDKSRSEVVRILQNEGLLCEPVMNDREVYESEHYRTRGTVRWMEDPLFGDVLVQGTYSAGLLSQTPRRLYWIWRPVGADNVKIYHELLGYPISKVQEWYDKAWI
jgi:crotonobetainyl-CoA:carnitine CoA-transferase CaiB-like acyl-CoA transferase